MHWYYMPTFIDCMLLKNVTCVTSCVFRFLKTVLFAHKSLCLSAAQKRDYGAFTTRRQHLFFQRRAFISLPLCCSRSYYKAPFPRVHCCSSSAELPLLFCPSFNGRRTIARLLLRCKPFGKYFYLSPKIHRCRSYLTLTTTPKKTKTRRCRAFVKQSFTNDAISYF